MTQSKQGIPIMLTVPKEISLGELVRNILQEYLDQIKNHVNGELSDFNAEKSAG